MLGRLKMTLAEVQSAYLAFASKIFTPKLHKLNPTRAYDKLKATGKYQSEELNKYIQDLLRSRGMSQDELLKDPDPENCKVSVNYSDNVEGLTIVDLSALCERRIRLQLLLFGHIRVLGLTFCTVASRYGKQRAPHRPQRHSSTQSRSCLSSKDMLTEPWDGITQ